MSTSMTPDALAASPRATGLALSALTYANAILAYGVLTWPEAASPADGIRKVAVSLPWLIAFATPFAAVFGLAGGWLARRTYAAMRPRGAAASLLAALAAFLVPAAMLTEAALAARDGWDWGRLAIQLVGGAAVAALATPLLRWR